MIRAFLSLLVALPRVAWGRWGDGILQSENPLMVVYLENSAGWERDYFVSDLEKYVLSRNMPVRNWVINYAFLTWNAGECRLVPVDTEVSFSKADPSLYDQPPVWWSPGVKSHTSGAIPALLSLKQKYPYIKLLPSVGGSGTRSHTFHQCLISKPDVMVQSSVDVINSFGFDGIDFDWEYPNCDGAGAKCGCQEEGTCPNPPNIAGPHDWEHYKVFLTRLRTALDHLEDKLQKRLYVTAALRVTPSIIDGENETYSAGTPYEWICGSDIVDWVNLKTYDYYGPWTAKTGPLAPLFSTPDSIANEGTKQMSIDDSVKRILARCSRPEKLSIGLPAYGKLWKSVPQGQGLVAGLWSVSTDPQSPGALGTWEAGTISFWDIKQSLETSSLCEKTFDNYSQTATLYCEMNPKLNTETNVFVSYDDGRAWSEKMHYARSHGFAGGTIWAASDIGKASSSHAEELLSGVFEGWFGETKIMDSPYSNGKRDFQVPLPYDDFPCPIPYDANGASMMTIPNACYGGSVDSSTYQEREPFKMPPTSSVLDMVGKNQKLIHGYASSITTMEPGTEVSSKATALTSLSTATSHEKSERTKTPRENSSSSHDGSSIEACKNFMVSQGREPAITAECGLLCRYYSGCAWCPPNSSQDGEVLAQCVLSMAPYCQQK